ncbi:MAG: 5'-methylthioadenosine/adenosylhomocysteine nucleosidase [Burkholderiales bacterium]
MTLVAPPPARTAIVSAMAEELAALIAQLDVDQVEVHGRRTFHRGRLHGEPVVLVLSGIGKVAAATTAALLAARYGVERIVFTGVAGGLGAGVRVGDVVLASELLQHDMDASPLFPRYEVPLTGRSRFADDAPLREQLAQAAAQVLGEPGHFGPEAVALGVNAPALHQGLVVSGDRFVATAAESRALLDALPDALAVEMEGAALAQVCHDLQLPFAVLRTISDRADDSAHVDFLRFIRVVAAKASADIVGAWLRDQAG